MRLNSTVDRDIISVTSLKESATLPAIPIHATGRRTPNCPFFNSISAARTCCASRSVPPPPLCRTSSGERGLTSRRVAADAAAFRLAVCAAGPRRAKAERGVGREEGEGICRFIGSKGSIDFAFARGAQILGIKNAWPSIIRPQTLSRYRFRVLYLRTVWGIHPKGTEIQAPTSNNQHPEKLQDPSSGQNLLSRRACASDRSV